MFSLTSEDVRFLGVPFGWLKGGFVRRSARQEHQSPPALSCLWG
jgi:hypothetical protein